MKGRRARALGFACLLAFGAALPSRAQTAPSPAPAAPAPPEDPVPAPPADAATAVLPPVAAPAADRITFEVKFADEQGGGKASGSAGTIDYEREDLAVATGGVELQYQDITVHAERVSVDLAKKEVEAQGGVVLDQGPRRLAGDTAPRAHMSLLAKDTRLAVAAGRAAYLAGRMPRREIAVPSSPTRGMLG